MGKKYQVLARKYRPQTFSEVVGQQAIITTLQNAIRLERLSHSYLFCGPRGVGKTTLARLLAKTLNCKEGKYEPCNQCPSCQEITSGSSMDVIEIDGASHRGIDDIRQINETSQYAPSAKKYKIYIIDEVHMLTKEAFNALLKTLEEPPESVKFFFATTEPHKILPTIISRCQRFDPTQIPPSLIEKKLLAIAEELSREIDLEALSAIASFSEGSLRDAESLLDQLLCYEEGKITVTTVRKAFGQLPQEMLFALDQAVLKKDLSYGFTWIASLIEQGKDLNHILHQLIEHYRHIVSLHLEQTLPKHLPKEYEACLNIYSKQESLAILRTLLYSASSLSQSPSPRAFMEMLIVEIIEGKQKTSLPSLVERLESLQKSLNDHPPTSTSLDKQAPKELLEPLSKSLPLPIEKNSSAEPTENTPRKEYPKEPTSQPLVLEKTPFSFSAPLVSSEKTSSSPTEPLEQTKPLEKQVVSSLEKENKEKVSLPSKLSITPSTEIASELPGETLELSSEKVEQKTKTNREKKPQHYYDTLLRFAAVELEGVVKNY